MRLVLPFRSVFGEWTTNRYKANLSIWSKKGSGNPPVEPTEPIKTRYVINDATTESVAHCLGGNSRGLVLMRDELAGWFNAFGQYKNSDADSPFWLECFEAGTYSVDRRGIKKPVYISRCSVSVTGTTQPATLQRFLENGIAVENGMLHRFLLAYPPERAIQWTTQEVDPQLIEAVQKLFDELLSLGFYFDSDGKEPGTDSAKLPAGVPQEALEELGEWYDEILSHLKYQKQTKGIIERIWAATCHIGFVLRFRLFVRILRLLLDLIKKRFDKSKRGGFFATTLANTTALEIKNDP